MKTTIIDNIVIMMETLQKKKIGNGEQAKDSLFLIFYNDITYLYIFRYNQKIYYLLSVSHFVSWVDCWNSWTVRKTSFFDYTLQVITLHLFSFTKEW